MSRAVESRGFIMRAVRGDGADARDVGVREGEGLRILRSVIEGVR